MRVAGIGLVNEVMMHKESPKLREENLGVKWQDTPESFFSWSEAKTREALTALRDVKDKSSKPKWFLFKYLKQPYTSSLAEVETQEDMRSVTPTPLDPYARRHSKPPPSSASSSATASTASPSKFTKINIDLVSAGNGSVTSLKTELANQLLQITQEYSAFAIVIEDQLHLHELTQKARADQTLFSGSPQERNASFKSGTTNCLLFVHWKGQSKSDDAQREDVDEESHTVDERTGTGVAMSDVYCEVGVYDMMQCLQVRI
jgi:hypothetical protein